MDNYSILGIISFVVVLFSLFFSFFLFTVESKTKLSNRIFGTLLFLTAIDISSFFYHRFIDMPLGLEMIRVDLTVLNQPLLFFYVLSLIFSDFKLKRIHLLHFIPYVLTFVVLFPRFYGVNRSDKEVFFDNYLYNPEVIFIISMSYIVSIAYKIYIFYILDKGKKIMLENYSDLGKSNLKWLFQLNVFSSVILIFALAKTISKYFVPNFEALNAIRIFVVVLVLVFTCWLILKALYRPEIFRGIRTDQKPLRSIINKEGIVVDKGKEIDPKIERLKDQVLDQKPFLDPQLTIQALAHQVNIPVTELSILINHKIGKHFFDFINEYRINEAKEILSDPSQSDLTILEILYRVGFNSKSSFNSAFKKYTMMTPSQFRKQAVN